MNRAVSSTIFVLCVTILVLSIIAVGSAAGQTTVTGVSVDVGPEESADIREQANTVLDQVPGQDNLNENIVVAYTDTEGTVAISTDESTATGSIEASGELYGDNIPRRPNARVDAVLIADDVEFTTEAETDVTVDTLQNNPESVENELVEVTTDYRQLTANSDALDGEVVSTYRTGSLTPIDTPLLGEGAIGDSARAFTRDVAEADTPQDATGSIESQARAVGFGGQNDYWTDTEATVTLAVVDEGPEYMFFISDVEFESTETTLDAIRTGEHEDGEIVTVNGNFAQSRISIKETLIAASECSEDTFLVPNVGCVPAVADTVIEAGLLHEGTDWLLAAGVSNRIQGEPTVESYQEVQITGEVVDAGEIDPALADRRALIIYDIEQQGEIDPADVSQEILEEQTALTDRLDQQLRTTADESPTTQEGQQAINGDADGQTSGAGTGGSSGTSSNPIFFLITLASGAASIGGLLISATGVLLIGVALVNKIIESRFTNISVTKAITILFIGVVLFFMSTIIAVISAIFSV